MNVRVLADADTLAREAAAVIAADVRRMVDQRGRYVLAVSGGQTPALMLRALVAETVPWDAVYILQVDERVAPAGHSDRNFTHLQANLLLPSHRLPEHLYPMPVELPDLHIATARYARTLVDLAGSPPVFDLVHLGLGRDGHTASLVPGDPVLSVVDVPVALTEDYQGRRRMTLTFPVLNRAQRVVWLVTGSEKAAMLARLCRGDASIPAGRVCRDRASVWADVDAARDLSRDPQCEIPPIVGE